MERARKISLLKNIAFGVFCVFTIDGGCVIREPHTELLHGYSVSAISWSSPCSMQYRQSDDDRTYSDFVAISHRGDRGKGRDYVISNDTERFKYSDEESWRLAGIKHRVEPSGFLPRISDITKVASDDRNVIGVYENGYFLLTYETNHVQTFDNEADWKQSVAQETKLASAWMHDPKAYYMQSRPWGAYLFYLLMMCWAIKDGFQERISTPESHSPLL